MYQLTGLPKNRPHGAVVAWLDSVDDEEVFLSAVTLGGLQAGVELTRHQDPTKANQIEAWLDQVADSCRNLPMDGRAFREWARLMDGRPNRLLENALLAATARVHRLTVVTGNTRGFKPFDVPVFDPFPGNEIASLRHRPPVRLVAGEQRVLHGAVGVEIL